MSGTCRFCGCTHFNPCPEGCGWLDRQQTVCTACAAVQRAWRIACLDVKALPNMTKAFARGFFAATTDERAIDGRGDVMAANPYRTGGNAWRWWYRGWDAGGEKSTGIGTPILRKAARANG